jgi:hypothetical protein
MHITREEMNAIDRAMLDYLGSDQRRYDDLAEKVAKDVEKVNHPDHYNQIHGIECIDVIEQMPFNTGNAMKYLWRYLDKGEPITDLEKAIWYIQREIDRLRGEN